jgi:hypothetical protein
MACFAPAQQVSSSMSHWSDGYVTEIGYTHGYYHEMAPSWLTLCLLSRGIAPPSGRPWRYLELGYGQGLSLNIHAAANEGTFVGNDFNPAHAANAADLARSSGAALSTLEASFEELTQRDDIGECDVIALHGIWSWVSPKNHEIIVDIIRRRLAVGGILYMSYNCTPGWSAGIPLRHLMSLHATLASSSGSPMPSRIDAAIAFLERVAGADARYFKSNPAVGERLAKLKSMSRSYLAHEYMNADWHVMPFSDIAARLDRAKLSFAASANLLDHIDGITLNDTARQLLDEITHPVLRESVRDYIVNTQFRKDIWVRGARTLTPLETRRQMSAQRFALTTLPGDIQMSFAGLLGPINMFPDVCQPVIEELARDKMRAKSLEEVMAALPKLTYRQVREALILLCCAGHARPALPEKTVRIAKQRTSALNAALIERAQSSSDSLYLASPVTGSGVSVNRLQQMFLGERNRGRKTERDWAEGTWRTLDTQGQRVIKDGKLLDGAEANLADLQRQATEFAQKRLPVLTALQVA